MSTMSSDSLSVIAIVQVVAAGSDARELHQLYNPLHLSLSCGGPSSWWTDPFIPRPHQLPIAPISCHPAPMDHLNCKRSPRCIPLHHADRKEQGTVNAMVFDPFTFILSCAFLMHQKSRALSISYRLACTQSNDIHTYSQASI